MDADIRKKLQQAKRLFLASMGSATNTEMGEKVGLTRQTIAKHRKQERWDAEVHAVQIRTTEKIVEKASSDISSDILKFLKNIQSLASEKLVAKDEHGNYLRDEAGNLMPNRDLSPSQILALTKAAEVHLRNFRLVSGQSTSHELVGHVNSGYQPNNDHEMHGSLGRLVERIESSEDGFPAGQAKLYELARIFQEACSLADDEG